MATSDSDPRKRLQGCYVTLPTMFRDDAELSVDLDAMRRHVRFLVDGGITTGTGVLLAGGAAGDFSTMTFDERVAVTEAVVSEAAGRVPVVMGGQTTSTRELVRLARKAAEIGADFMQVSPPFYFAHTQDDFYDYVAAAAAASDVGLVVYNTHWSTPEISNALIDRLAELRDGGRAEVVDARDRVHGVRGRRGRLLRTLQHHRQPAPVPDQPHARRPRHRGPHLQLLAAVGCNDVAPSDRRPLRRRTAPTHRRGAPFMRLWEEIENYTSGDGYLDKLCMELVGLPSSRCRPPTRDIRDRYRDKARAMLAAIGAPLAGGEAELLSSSLTGALGTSSFLPPGDSG